MNCFLVLGRGIEPLLQDWESWVLTVIRTERFCLGLQRYKQFLYMQIFLANYFKNTKKTAMIRQMKATRWFHCNACPLNMKVAMTVNTVREITSCITLSCIRLNGPPLASNPILLAGTCAQYSRNATPHEKSITSINGQLVDIFISWSLRWPYHAKVMNTLDAISRSIVQIAFIVYRFAAAKVIFNL